MLDMHVHSCTKLAYKAELLSGGTHTDYGMPPQDPNANTLLSHIQKEWNEGLSYRGHVVRCSNKCLGKAEVVVEDPGKAKVSQLHVVTAIKEYISWFQVTMKNLERKRERGGRGEGEASRHKLCGRGICIKDTVWLN